MSSDSKENEAAIEKGKKDVPSEQWSQKSVIDSGEKSDTSSKKRAFTEMTSFEKNIEQGEKLKSLRKKIKSVTENDQKDLEEIQL